MKITLVPGTAFSYEEETPQNGTSKQISGFLDTRRYRNWAHKISS